MITPPSSPKCAGSGNWIAFTSVSSPPVWSSSPGSSPCSGHCDDYRAGLALIADGIAVGTDGFTGGVPNLVAWAAVILFAVIATIAAWWLDRSDRPAEHRPAQDRLSRT